MFRGRLSLNYSYQLSHNVEKKKNIFHNYQRVIANGDIPDLKINGKNIEQVSCFNFLNDKWIHELEFIFRKDCQQNFSYIGYNAEVKVILSIFSHETHVWLFDFISSVIWYNMLGFWVE